MQADGHVRVATNSLLNLTAMAVREATSIAVLNNTYCAIAIGETVKALDCKCPGGIIIIRDVPPPCLSCLLELVCGPEQLVVTRVCSLHTYAAPPYPTSTPLGDVQRCAFLRTTQ